MSASKEKSIVITGASTGIGYAAARVFLEDGWQVFGSVRKAADAERLTSEYPNAFTALVFDVTDDEAIDRSAAKVRELLDGRTLKGLINNAGIAVTGPLQHIPMDELRFQFAVNVFGLARVSQAFIPLLGADKSLGGKPGKIVNMSSVAGKVSAPLFGPYTMSKHALEAYSHSLRRELLMYGIDVVIVGPGSIKTPIWDKADDTDTEQYRNTDYHAVFDRVLHLSKVTGERGMPPERLGRLLLDILHNDAPKWRYAIVADRLTMWTLPRLLPTRLLDKIMTKRFGFPKKA
ncbi:MAG: SDR family oxidoreductase [Pseudomonadota bacterium]